uniref:Putative methyltransferase n=1 Tax=viral metagenome TaxID=1070528 RepID=A0A6H2A2X2_9ZZZZ
MNWNGLELPEAYYQDDAVYIIHGDCREILPKLPKVDLVLTDPPYGKECDIKNDSDSRWSAKNGFSDLWIENTQNEWNKKPDDEFLQEIISHGSNQIIWGGNYFNLGATRCYLIWDKMQREFSFADAEIAWTSLDKSCRIFDYSRGAFNAEYKFHPTQKPISLMRWSIEQSGECATILDPYMGSGSTIRAAKDLNRKCIGIEIEEKYCEIAAKRCSQGVFDLGL